MAANGRQSPVLSPPIVILTCILGALVSVVLGAVIYRLCRKSSETVLSDDSETVNFNPNKRSAEQIQRMEEVRWINNMYIWDRAREEEEYERGWYYKRIAAKGYLTGHERVDVYKSRYDSHQSQYNNVEISAERFLEDYPGPDNPYRDMLDERASRLYERCNHTRGASQDVTTMLDAEVQQSEPGQSYSMYHGPERFKRLNTATSTSMNFDGHDIVENYAAHPWTRPTRMIRSSSLYSDDLMPLPTQSSMVPSASLHTMPALVRSLQSHGQYQP